MKKASRTREKESEEREKL